MLPRRHRLTDSRMFAAAVRAGRRIPSGPVIGHLLVDADAADPPRLGLIVSKQVGDSVRRHRVSRIMRHAAAPGLLGLPAGSVLVLRALPAAGRDPEAVAGAVARILERATRAAP